MICRRKKKGGNKMILFFLLSVAGRKTGRLKFRLALSNYVYR